VLREKGAEIEHWPLKWEPSVIGVGRFAYWKVVAWLFHDRLIEHVTVTSKLEPDVVEALAQLENPKSIMLYGPSEDETGNYGKTNDEWRIAAPPGAIERIIRSKSLTHLVINDFELSDDAFAAIGQQRLLEELDLNNTQLTDEHLASLITLPLLRHFSFISCPATGICLNGASGSATLESLYSGPSPAALALAAFVGRSPAMNTLTVRVNPKDGDDFLAAIGQHQSLVEIWGLRGITARSVQTLKAMPSLRLVAPSSGIREDVRNCLEKARPDLRL
jgi:hypothetical protein